MAWANGGRTRTTTPEHRRWRIAVLRRDSYQCQACGHQGAPGDGIIQADHILNIKRGGAPHDPDNGQALCKHCHDHKTQAEARAAKARNSNRRPRERHPGLL